ncbi:hypothetical protein ACIQU6_40875 [Streptomyces sp. NPDC090442]|uniref:hypothetical protein n=1 Tax=Streptomyces sp. NPDC090442 TaxID=3365962 RepID=UPI0038234F32
MREIPALDEVSKGARTAPVAAMLTVSGPDGAALGPFAADARDAEIPAQRIHQTSADRYPFLDTEQPATAPPKPTWSRG